jgi:hypothetical protein
MVRIDKATRRSQVDLPYHVRKFST